jgi:HAE1 family hydrophobic/amphiphilic exporter-1
MFISDFAIKRPIITVVSMLALVVFGLFALFRLQTDEFPEVAPPIVTVAIPYPGASPDGVERELLDPIEEAIASIAGVKKVASTAQDGFATIQVEFTFDKPLQEATQDVRDAISGIRGDLPPEMEEPIIKKFSETDQPIISLAVSSTVLTSAELTRLVDPGLTRQLRSIPGVAEVTIPGKVERELTVEIQPDRMQAAGVSVGEVAQVRDATEEPRTLALFNGREAVGVDIKKSTGYSTTTVAGEIVARLDEVKKTLPAGTTIDVVKNKGVNVRNSVRNVQEALVEGALLTVLVVFIFLNSWRSTVITGLALPVSVLASFIAVWALGFRLETMSLLGLSLAIGILIDDAIVVRENIVRHVEMGKDHYTAAREGTDEIGLAVAATTFSILAVFVPIAFMPGVGGQWFRPFALTIACSVLVSLFVSFSLDPMLSAYWPDPHREEHEKGFVTRALDKFNRWFDRQAEKYRGVIAWALDHRWKVSIMAAATFFLALAMPMITIGDNALVGVSFFPEDDNAELNIIVETPPGSNLEYTRLKTEQIAALTRKHPEVRYTYTTLGSGDAGAVDVGKVYVKLVPKDRRSLGVEGFSSRLREEFGPTGGAKVAVLATDWGGGRKQVAIELRGSDSEALQEFANRALTAARTVPGLVDVGLSSKGQKPELNVELNRGLASSIGLTVGQVAQSLRPAFAGVDVGDWVDPSGETRDVYVRLSPEARRRAADLRQLPLVVQGADGVPRTLPLGQVATVTDGLGPAVINHLDRDRVVQVEFNTSGRSMGEVTGDALARIEALSRPPGVRVSTGGEAQQQSEVFVQIFSALGLALLFMYLILVVQFGSFLDPLAIMFSLPLSLIGVMLSLAITRNTINLMSLIGVILLAGIVAKNAILLIDFAKMAREEKGMPLREALIEAGAIRLRPILMTTFALVAGMLPVALGRGEGSQFRSPLGIAVIGGVITSTLLTLIAIPTFYEILDGWRETVAGWFGRRPSQRTAEHRLPMSGPAATPVSGD